MSGRLVPLFCLWSAVLAACTSPNPHYTVDLPDRPSDLASDDARSPDAGVSDTGAPGEPAEYDRPPPAPDAPDAPDAGAAPVGGLRGDYFIGRSFEQLAFSRIDTAVNFAWVHDAPDPRLPVDDFSVRWTGEIRPRYSELYTFHLDHDDGVRLWIGGQVVIDRWDRTGQNEQGQIRLTAGQSYPVQIEFFDLALTATIRFHWSSATQSKEIVPTTHLHTPPLP
jgi:hypothetical protein